MKENEFFVLGIDDMKTAKLKKKLILFK
jgi:hypothetical protein